MPDKELTVVRNKEETGGLLLDDDEAGTGNKDNTMDSIMLLEDIGQVTPSMGQLYHHTDKSTQYPNSNTMVLVVPESDRNVGSGEDTIPDPDHPAKMIILEPSPSLPPPNQHPRRARMMTPPLCLASRPLPSSVHMMGRVYVTGMV